MSQHRYSASGLKMYKSCKLKFDLYYNKEIKLEREITPDTSFGLLVHEIAENYTGKNFNELYEIVNKYKNNLNEQYKKVLPQTIENMFLWLQKYSKLKSINEQELELKNDDYWLYGLADKVFPESKIFVDYKTAKYNNRDNHIFQMKLYNLILSKTWNCEPKDIKCIIYYPRLDEEDKILFNNKQIYQFEQEIKDLINEIENNKIWTPNKSYFCNWCEYKDTKYCPIRS